MLEHIWCNFHLFMELWHFRGRTAHRRLSTTPGQHPPPLEGRTCPSGTRKVNQRWLSAAKTVDVWDLPHHKCGTPDTAEVWFVFCIIQPTCWETYYTHTLVICIYIYVYSIYTILSENGGCRRPQNIELYRDSHYNLFIGFWAPWFWQLLWWWQTKHRPVNKLAVKRVKRQNETSSQSVLNNLQHGNAPGRKTWNLPDFQNLCRCVAIRSQSNWSARSVCSKGWYNTCKQFNQRWTPWILYGSRQVPDLDIWYIYMIGRYIYNISFIYI